MTQYETAFLVSPNLEEEETDKIIAQMAEVVSKKKGKMIHEDRWGKRKLAYPIKRFEEAFYVFFHYEGDSDIPFELERRFKQSEAILRYLTVKKELRKDMRRKKAAPMEKEKAAPPEEDFLEDEAAEKETLDREGKVEEMPGEEKEEAEKKDTAEEEGELPEVEEESGKKEAEDKEDAAEKTKPSDEEKAADEKAPVEEEARPVKEEEAEEGTASSDEKKEEE